jgi:peptidoglycan L-alanyl-D-glutamate endopeptidase CwlK
MPSDKITIERIALLHPKLRGEALAIYDEIVEALGDKVICRFTHTLRTIAEQNKLYAIGRTSAGRIVTNARGGESYHNYGLAIDIVLMHDNNNDWIYETISYNREIDKDNDGLKDWHEVVNIFKKYNWKWGGDFKTFKDYPHFEKNLGYSISKLKSLYNAKKVDKNNYVLI